MKRVNFDALFPYIAPSIRRGFCVENPPTIHLFVCDCLEFSNCNTSMNILSCVLCESGFGFSIDCRNSNGDSSEEREMEGKDRDTSLASGGGNEDNYLHRRE